LNDLLTKKVNYLFGAIYPTQNVELPDKNSACIFRNEKGKVQAFLRILFATIPLFPCGGFFSNHS